MNTNTHEIASPAEMATEVNAKASDIATNAPETTSEPVNHDAELLAGLASFNIGNVRTQEQLDILRTLLGDGWAEQEKALRRDIASKHASSLGMTATKLHEQDMNTDGIEPERLPSAVTAHYELRDGVYVRTHVSVPGQQKTVGNNGTKNAAATTGASRDGSDVLTMTDGRVYKGSGNGIAKALGIYKPKTNWRNKFEAMCKSNKAEYAEYGSYVRG